MPALAASTLTRIGAASNRRGARAAARSVVREPLPCARSGPTFVKMVLVVAIMFVSDFPRATFNVKLLTDHAITGHQRDAHVFVFATYPRTSFGRHALWRVLFVIAAA